jgi:hypothetical protein
MLETVRTFAALSEEFVEEGLRLWPVRATAAGIHDYDHLLPEDTGRPARAWRGLGNGLRLVPWEELPTEQRVIMPTAALAPGCRACDRGDRTHARTVGCLRTA